MYNLSDDPRHDVHAYLKQQEDAEAAHKRCVAEELDRLITDYEVRRYPGRSTVKPYLYDMLIEFGGEVPETDYRAISECFKRDGTSLIVDEAELGRLLGKACIKWFMETAEQNAEV